MQYFLLTYLSIFALKSQCFSDSTSMVCSHMFSPHYCLLEQSYFLTVNYIVDADQRNNTCVPELCLASVGQGRGPCPGPRRPPVCPQVGPTHPPTYNSFTYPPTHSPTFSPTHSLLTHSPTYSLTYSLTHLLTYPPTHSPTRSFTHFLSHSPTHHPPTLHPQ